MILYLDTSLLVAVMTVEAKTAQAQIWLAAQNTDTLAISEWVATEFSAALSIKLRTGQLSAEHRTQALANFKRTIAESFFTLPVSRRHFRAAGTFAGQYALGLRAGDALHLAISADHGLTLCTLDRRMADAGQALGVKTLLL